MIAKAIPSSSFANLTEYLFGNREDKDEAKILAVNAVRYDSPRNMANDFEFIRRQRPAKQKAAIHLILSFHKKDKIGTYEAIQIAEAFLKEMKINNTQYAIIEHSGVKEHKHLHIACNMVNLDIQAINESFIGLRCKKAAEKLTKQFGLIEVQEKSRESTNLEALNRKERAKAEIYFKTKELLPYVNSLDELKTYLKKEQIILTTIGKPGSLEIAGCRFTKEGFTFKGSQVHQSLSYTKILESIDSNKSLASNEIKYEPQINIPTGRKLIDVPDEYLPEEEPREKEKRKITKALSSLLTYVPSLLSLIKKLKQQGIDTEILYKKPSGTVQGICFKIPGSDIVFKGSELSRKFSYSNIEKTLEENARQEKSPADAPAKPLPDIPGTKKSEHLKNYKFKR